MTELHSQNGDQQMLDYYTPNFDCGFSGGSQMPTAMGTAKNAHFQGSGMNKVFREVTIVKTGGGGAKNNPQASRLARNQRLNRRRAIALDSIRQQKLLKRISKTQDIAPIEEISSSQSSNDTQSVTNSKNEGEKITNGTMTKQQSRHNSILLVKKDARLQSEDANGRSRDGSQNSYSNGSVKIVTDAEQKRSQSSPKNIVNEKSKAKGKMIKEKSTFEGEERLPTSEADMEKMSREG